MQRGRRAWRRQSVGRRAERGGKTGEETRTQYMQVAQRSRRSRRSRRGHADQGVRDRGEIEGIRERREKGRREEVIEEIHTAGLETSPVFVGATLPMQTSAFSMIKLIPHMRLFTSTLQIY